VPDLQAHLPAEPVCSAFFEYLAQRPWRVLLIALR
jgi:hypothetical protein